MATSFQKSYSITVKYTKLDGAALADTDANVVVFRAKIKAAVAAVVPASQGAFNAQIVGSVSET